MTGSSRKSETPNGARCSGKQETVGRQRMNGDGVAVADTFEFLQPLDNFKIGSALVLGRRLKKQAVNQIVYQRS